MKFTIKEYDHWENTFTTIAVVNVKPKEGSVIIHEEDIFQEAGLDYSKSEGVMLECGKEILNGRKIGSRYYFLIKEA